MDHKVFVVFIHFGFGLISCYHDTPVREYHYINLSMKWDDAQHYCRVKHTDLATIGRPDAILKRPNGVSSRAWIGLSDDPQSWKGVMGTDSNSWRWSAIGKTIKTGYQKRSESQPNNDHGVEGCVLVGRNGRWIDYDCQYTGYFICYTACRRNYWGREKCKTTNPPGQKTYTAIDIGKTWKDAQAYCRKYYTDLAMIENDQDNTEISSLKPIFSRWIGLYRVPWRWSDKSIISYTNWKSGEPDNDGGNQHCVAEMSDHLWTDMWCNNKLPFFCHGALKVKRTMVRMKIETDADMSDPATNAQIQQQVSAALANEGLTDFKLKVKISPRKQREEKDEAKEIPFHAANGTCLVLQINNG